MSLRAEEKEHACTAWVIRRCLTQGIKVMEGWRSSDTYFMRRGEHGLIDIYKIGREAFFSEAEAIAAAKLAQKRKIASLKKELARVKARTF